MKHSVIRHLSVAAISASAALVTPQFTRDAQAGLLDQPQDASQICGTAVQAAETQYTLPNGLLFAISQVESGRPMGDGTSRRPWPWTVQAENQSHFFGTKAAAIRWVEQAQARGVTSIDVGCMQVNLMYHPHAFRSIADAFDPTQNANYAARFLISLHAQTKDWTQAAGAYHSQTLALAIPYRQQVEALLGGHVPAQATAPRDSSLQALQTAWNATANDGTMAETPDLTGNWARLAEKPAARPAPKRRHWRPILLSDAH